MNPITQFNFTNNVANARNGADAATLPKQSFQPPTDDDPLEWSQPNSKAICHGQNGATGQRNGFQSTRPTPSRRVVAVSNRGVSATKPSAGGLAVALGEALSQEKSVWFGWSGELSEHPGQVTITMQSDHCQRAVIDLTAAAFQPYYDGYCNSTLWPILSSCPKWANFSPTYYSAYLQVNQTFACHLEPLLSKDDIVWVHDYHLIPLAAALRQRGCHHAIGFFIHTPFPDPQTFRAIPEHAELAKQWMAYDLIGMQTGRDINNFKTYLRDTLPVRITDETTLHYLQRRIWLKHFPIGIDVARIRTLQPSPTSTTLIAKMRYEASQRTLMIGVDRLDYAKGIPRKIKAFSDLIAHYPSMRRRVSLVQVAAPSRDGLEPYQRLRKKTAQLVAATNSLYGDAEWMPVMFWHETVDRSVLPSLYALSPVCVVSSVADGMNLVAKEYVACQDAKDPGVLVLSHESGAAEHLKDAILFPAKNRQALTHAYHCALNLSLTERKRRYTALIDNIQSEDLHHWCNSYLNTLRRV